MAEEFDKTFGSDPGVAESQPETEPRFEELKRKYRDLIDTMEREGVQISKLRVQNNKLYIRAAAPSREAHDRVWDVIRRSDPETAEIEAEITMPP